MLPGQVCTSSAQVSLNDFISLLKYLVRDKQHVAVDPSNRPDNLVFTSEQAPGTYLCMQSKMFEKLCQRYVIGFCHRNSEFHNKLQCTRFYL